MELWILIAWLSAFALLVGGAVYTYLEIQYLQRPRDPQSLLSPRRGVQRPWDRW